VYDLLAQMTLQEKAASLAFGGIAGHNGNVAGTINDDAILYAEDFYTASDRGTNDASMTVQVKEVGVTTFIAALTGTPKEQLDLLNKLQTIGEDGRLGIPIVFSGDRSYNTWGGMIDMPHYAFGVAHDEELLYDLVSQYAIESVALGYHQVFHGYGNEIGSFYGDEVNYIAKMSAIETRAYDDHGFNSHSKHFIARGGRNAYAAAKSPADLIDSWLVGWKAVVDAGTQWVMTNNAEGVTPGVQAYMDKDTFDLLRVTLGYDGIICLDWPLDADSIMQRTGITSAGIDISTLTLGQRYALILDAGIDMFSCYVAVPGEDTTAYAGLGFQRYFPDVLVAEVNSGAYAEESLNAHVYRILRNKFDLGIFENPYRDWEAAADLIATEAYKADQFELLSNADIDLARKPLIAELEDELMVKSTILMKNDGVLPLSDGVKLYVHGGTETIKAADAAALGARAQIVETMEEADYIYLHVTSFDDAYELAMEDAQIAGKPVILVCEMTNSESTEPGLYEVENTVAILAQTYNNTPDHGSSIGSFYRYVTPATTAAMLFGEKEPSGSTLFEIGYNPEYYALSWGELQHDIGVDPVTRLYMAGMARENPNVLMPSNVGDLLYTTGFGMRYGAAADITLDTLVVPQALTTEETESNGSVSVTTSVSNAIITAGVPFEVSFLATNNGADGYLNAEVYDNGALIATKFIALDAGQWRVITIELTLEAGEHNLTIGGMSATINVE
jgi:beta-glucosidase-like glycosyl hydrolase